MKNNYPLTSIILPVYNGENVISRSIESVLAQDYPCIELIVVDDGSMDHTREIVSDYAEKHVNIRLLTLKNQGVSNARNVGISASNGEYIAFLDADDELMPDIISTSMNLIQKNNADIVCTNSYYVDDGHIISKMGEIRPNDSILTDEHGKRDLIRQLYCNTNEPYFGDYLRASWGKLYSAELLRKHQIQFPVGVPIGEDSIFLLYAFYYAQKIVFKDAYLYKYYRSDQSVTGRVVQQFYEKRVAEYLALKTALNNLHYSFDHIDEIFWHRSNFENIGNALKSDRKPAEKIRTIRDFYKEPYCRKYLSIPVTGKKDQIRALLMHTHQYSLMAMIDYYSKKDKLGG